MHLRQRGGVPRRAERSKILASGDIVNVDVTAVVDGWHGDTSKTFSSAAKPPRRRMRKDSSASRANLLELGVRGCRPGGHVGDITAPIRKHLEEAGYAVVNATSWRTAPD